MTSSFRWTLVMSCVLAGCTTEVADAPRETDASTDADASGSVVDAPSRPDVQEIPANRAVRFHVTNQGGSPLMLARQGLMCRSWQVEKRDGESWQMLALSLSNQSEFCSCQAACDSPGNRNTSYEELAPAGERVLDWDGRSLVTWVEEHACAEDSSRKRTTVEGVWQPVASGHYRVTVGLETVLPKYCSFDKASEQWHCNFTDPWAEPPGIEKMCPAALTASAEFDIPESGDLDVTISFPPTSACEPAGSWEVSTYDCYTYQQDTVVIAADGDGGLTGTMTTHVPADAGSPETSSSVTVDTAKCQLKATSISTWAASEIPACDKRELSAELHGDTGHGIMKFDGCGGNQTECTAVLKRE